MRIWLLLIVISLLFIDSAVYAYTDSRIADAIYNAENSVKYPYGIKSIDTKSNKDYARQICLNTIRNQHKRHNAHKCNKDFITCLGDRYCPPNAHILNKNWIKNVKYFLSEGGD